MNIFSIDLRTNQTPEVSKKRSNRRPSIRRAFTYDIQEPRRVVPVDARHLHPSYYFSRRFLFNKRIDDVL